MFTLAAAAILGAALGLFVRPRILGVLVAVLLVGAVEGGALALINMLDDQPNRELLIGRLHAVFGQNASDAIAPVVTALVGAILAAVMGRFSDPAKSISLTGDELRRKAGKDGRYARIQGMVEERQIHQRAESRIDSILGL